MGYEEEVAQKGWKRKAEGHSVPMWRKVPSELAAQMQAVCVAILLISVIESVRDMCVKVFQNMQGNNRTLCNNICE
jgi:hypothetical protein